MRHDVVIKFEGVVQTPLLVLFENLTWRIAAGAVQITCYDHSHSLCRVINALVRGYTEIGHDIVYLLQCYSAEVGVFSYHAVICQHDGFAGEFRKKADTLGVLLITAGGAKICAQAIDR